MKKILFLFLLFGLSVHAMEKMSLDWSQTDLAVVYLAQVGILFTEDQSILDTVQNNTLLDSSVFWGFMSKAGNGLYLLPASYALSLVLKQDYDFFSFWYGDAIQAFLLSGVLTQIMKFSIGRSRPYREVGPYDFVGPSVSFSTHSFPSGHCQAIFSIATVFADKYNIGVFTYPLATLVAVSRIYNNKHWASDVLMGSFLGYMAGKFVEKQSMPKNRIFNFWYKNGVLHAQYVRSFNFI